MKHFRLIFEGIDVRPVLDQLNAHPELWNQHGPRRTYTGTPHLGSSDIWVRFNDYAKLDPSDFSALSDEHIPVWYSAWKVLPALRPIVFGLMAHVEGEMLGGVLITKVSPQGSIAPHRDASWHVEYYSKFYVFLTSPKGAIFGCTHENVTEELAPRVGECYFFDNRKLHWVENRSDEDRLTLIVCIRTDRFAE